MDVLTLLLGGFPRECNVKQLFSYDPISLFLSVLYPNPTALLIAWQGISENMGDVRTPSIRDGTYFEVSPLHPYAHAVPNSNYSRPFPAPEYEPQRPGQDRRDELQSYHERKVDSELKDFPYIRQHIPNLPESVPRYIYAKGQRSLSRGMEGDQFKPHSPQQHYTNPAVVNSTDSYRRPKDLWETPASSTCSVVDSSSFTDDSSLRKPPLCAVLYSGDQQRSDSRLGRGELNRPRRKLVVSMTPSELPILLGSQPLSYRQIAELKRISRHERTLQRSSTFNKSSREIDEPPNGGLSAWLQVLGAFFCVLNAQGLNMSFGIFQAYYELVLLRDSSPSKIAWIGI